MATKAELKAVLTLNNVGFVRAIKQSIQFAKGLSRQFKEAPIQTLFNAGVLSMRGVMMGAGSVISTVGGAILNTFKNIGIAAIAAGTAAAGGLAFITVEAIRTAAKVETLTTSFNFLLGSTKKGAEKMKDLWELASSRGMSIESAATGARKLQLLTGGAIHSARALEKVSDIATVMGDSFEDTSEKLGQLYTMMMAGQPVTRQLKELEKGGALTGYQAKQISGLAAGGMSAEAWMALERALSKWHGSFKAKENNWEVLMGRFRTAVDKAFAAFGTPIMESLKPALNFLVTTIDSVAGKVPDIGKQFGDGLKTGIDIVLGFLHDPHSAIDTFVDLFKAGIAEATDLLAQGIQTAMNLLSDKTFWTTLGNLLTKIGGSLWEGLAKSMGVDTDYFTKDFKKIGDLFNKIPQKKSGSVIPGHPEAGTYEELNAKKEATEEKATTVGEDLQKLLELTSKHIKTTVAPKTHEAVEHLKDAMDHVKKAAETGASIVKGETPLFGENKGLPPQAAFFAAQIAKQKNWVTSGGLTQANWFQQRMSGAQGRAGGMSPASGLTGRSFAETLAASGSFKDSLAGVGGALSMGAYGRTPLIRAREKRSMDNARRAEILARTGQREDGSTLIRRGDRARARAIQKEAQRTKSTEENQLLVQKSIEKYLIQIDDKFDSFVGG